jgi:hypothetical protein
LRVAVILVRHPLVQDILLSLRDAATDPDAFRRLAVRISVLLAAEALRELPIRTETVTTPLGEATGQRVAADVVVVPVLRAGLGMLDAVLELVPGARVGHIGLQRDEMTAVASRYYAKLHQSPEINLVSAHDHGYWDDPLPGKGWTWLYDTVAADMADAAYLQKPFLITEAGIPRDWTQHNLDLRAEKFRAKLWAFSQTETAGYILWNYEPSICTDYGIATDDPVWSVLEEASVWFRSSR